MENVKYVERLQDIISDTSRQRKVCAMTSEQFDKIVEEQIDSIRAVLKSKAQGYATDDDILHNFKAGAKEFGGVPSQVCWGYLLKHLVSVMDLAKGVRIGSREHIDEKIGDSINYLILLKAILLEGK